MRGDPDHAGGNELLNLADRVAAGVREIRTRRVGYKATIETPSKAPVTLEALFSTVIRKQA